MYLPVRVSTLIFSPVLMNNGTCTVIPVSSVMGFCTLLERIAADAFRGVGHR